MAHHVLICARVAELADALDLGSSVFDVGVQVPPRAPFLRTWLSGRASPCQGEGREFESRRPLHVFQNSFAPLAQLDRVFDYESKGRKFESLRARHFYNAI